jgi:peptide/nickel transport system ATP-binding protein
MILETKDLKKYFPVTKSFIERLFTREMKYVKAIDGVSIDVRKGEILSLVGESGSGKTTLGKLVLRLIDPTDGRIIFDGRDITYLKGEELRRLRRHMQIIYQDPYASLNPRMKIGESIKDPLIIHNIASDQEAYKMVLNMLEKVGLTPSEHFYGLYPRSLSGGQRQRVAIARAMITNPKFVVADEPVSMIDVSLRASILDLMLRFKHDLHLSYLFITHDLAVSKYISDRIAVMYLAKIVELGDVYSIFKKPLHPYTQALISAIPVPYPRREKKLSLSGEIPSGIDIPPGCRFHPRCPFKMNICSEEEPTLRRIEEGHYVACFLHQ